MTYEAWRISYQSSEQAARAAYAECSRLRAKIEQMGKQEPVAWAATDETCRIVEALSFNQSRRFDTPLYALPGAQTQPAPSIPDGVIDRLEAAEKECDALRAALQHETDCVEAAKAKIEALRAKIEQMGKQEPVRWGCTVLQVDGSWKEEIGIEEPPKDYFSIRNAFPLYALPGAQRAPSVPEGWKLVPIVSTEEMDNAGSEHCDGYLSTAQAVWDAMLAAAPEAKP